MHVLPSFLRLYLTEFYLFSVEAFAYLVYAHKCRTISCYIHIQRTSFVHKNDSNLFTVLELSVAWTEIVDGCVCVCVCMWRHIRKWYVFNSFQRKNKFRVFFLLQKISIHPMCVCTGWCHGEWVSRMALDEFSYNLQTMTVLAIHLHTYNKYFLFRTLHTRHIHDRAQIRTKHKAYG